MNPAYRNGNTGDGGRGMRLARPNALQIQGAGAGTAARGGGEDDEEPFDLRGLGPLGDVTPMTPLGLVADTGTPRVTGRPRAGSTCSTDTDTDSTASGPFVPPHLLAAHADAVASDGPVDYEGDYDYDYDRHGPGPTHGHAPQPRAKAPMKYA